MFRSFINHHIEYPVSQLGFIASIMTIPTDFGNTILKNVVSFFFGLLLLVITRMVKKRWPDKN